ncbi:MAG: phosphoribosyltransferase [Phycisphaerae bacterium]
MSGKLRAEDVVKEILFDEEQIREAIERCAQWLGPIAERADATIFYSLEGGRKFASALDEILSAGGVKKEYHPIKTSSYGYEQVSCGTVTISGSLENNHIRGKNVVLLDDILDSGRTMHTLKKIMTEKGAKQVSVCVLLERLTERPVDIQSDFSALQTERKEFFVGYGLDYKGQLRELDYIATI